MQQRTKMRVTPADTAPTMAYFLNKTWHNLRNFFTLMCRNLDLKGPCNTIPVGTVRTEACTWVCTQDRQGFSWKTFLSSAFFCMKFFPPPKKKPVGWRCLNSITYRYLADVVKIFILNNTRMQNRYYFSAVVAGPTSGHNKKCKSHLRARPQNVNVPVQAGVSLDLRPRRRRREAAA